MAEQQSTAPADVVAVGPVFRRNVAEMRQKAEGKGFDPSTLEAVRREARMFACGTCGHMNPDHRWSPPFDCLVCAECPGFPGAMNHKTEFWRIDDAFDEVWPPAPAVANATR